MAQVAMADAVSGNVASSAEYNKIIDNVEDLASRTVTLEGAGVGSTYVRAAIRGTGFTTGAGAANVSAYIDTCVMSSFTPVANTIYQFDAFVQFGAYTVNQLYFVRIFDGTTELTATSWNGESTGGNPGQGLKISYAFNSGGSPTAKVYKLQVVRWNAAVGSYTVNAGSTFTLQKVAAVGANFIVHT